MTKGIREFVNEKFAALLPTRVNTREGNTAFRKAVMQSAMETFGISLASAATHYNHTLKFIKETDPTLIEGLGRPEDKKGGRKPIHTVQVIKVKTGEPVGEPMSMEKAKKLVLASQEKGKVKLMIKDETPAEETPAAAEGAPVEAAASTEAPAQVAAGTEALPV
jgi:hypothetical protein